MWLRYLSLSILHWIAASAATFLLVQYVIPHALTGYTLAAPMWVIQFAIAFGFVMWAFHTKLPGRRETMMLLIIWFVITFALEAAFETSLAGRPAFLIYSTDLHVQYFLELAAILLAAYLTRRRRIKAVLSEGMTE